MAISLSVEERERRARQRAFSIREFSEAYRVGRAKIYSEIGSGRLRARKIGKHTVILDSDAADWLEGLPLLGPGTSSEVA
jgi:hypothetical protein